MLLLGLGGEDGELLCRPALDLREVPQLSGNRGLTPPVDVVVEPTLAHVALLAPGNVRGGDVDVVRPAAACLDRGEQVERAVHVGGEAVIDGRVEGHLAGAVDDDVEVIGQRRHVVEVALEHGDVVVEQRAQVVAAALAQPRECRPGQHVLDPVAGGQRAARAHEQRDRRVRQVMQQALEQGLADEASGSGDQDSLAGEDLGDRPGGHGMAVNHALRRAILADQAQCADEVFLSARPSPSRPSRSGRVRRRRRLPGGVARRDVGS